MQWSGDEAQCTFTIQLDEARRRSRFSVYRIRFLSTERQVNPQPVLHRIEAIPDLPPEIEILTPEKDHIQVPENGRQKLEVRAIDPDFGLHRMRLRGVSGGQSLMDEVLLDEPDGYSGQALETYDFQPQRLGLVAGDQLTWWALAEDNRTGPDGAAAANVTKTRNYTITIVPADHPAGTTPPNPAAEPSGSNEHRATSRSPRRRFWQ